jgi:hypothetical protein
MKARFQITDGFDNKSYLTIDKENIQYVSKNDTPLALSNISSNAAELRFKLEDCKSTDLVVGICNQGMDLAKNVVRIS